jgi:hypothetical protein
MVLTVQNVIDAVSQDVRLQLASKLAGAQQTALIDWTNRVTNEMMRWSNWSFMESIPYYFMTLKGQTDYWVGPKGQGPVDTVDTGLNLSNLDKVERDSVRDMSNMRALKWMKEQPIGPTLNYTSGMARLGQPAAYRQDPDTPFVLQIYPAPDNQNTTQPTPPAPFLTYLPGGSLPARMYFIMVTLVDSLGNESSASTYNQAFFVPANNLATIKSPVLVFPGTSTGVQYSNWNVYAVSVTPAQFNTNQSDPTTETLQNASPVAIGTDWTEPSSGLITTGQSWPQNNNLTQLGGYIVQFRYFQSRNQLRNVTDSIQVPSKYIDIIVHGVNAYAWRFLGRSDKGEEEQRLYLDGYRQMVVDKNLFPEGVEFIRPDAGTYVNQQILGYLPPFF